MCACECSMHVTTTSKKESGQSPATVTGTCGRGEGGLGGGLGIGEPRASAVDCNFRVTSSPRSTLNCPRSWPISPSPCKSLLSSASFAFALMRLLKSTSRNARSLCWARSLLASAMCLAARVASRLHHDISSQTANKKTSLLAHTATTSTAATVATSSTRLRR